MLRGEACRVHGAARPGQASAARTRLVFLLEFHELPTRAFGAGIKAACGGVTCVTCVARPERAVDACSGGSVCVWQARGSCVPAPHAAPCPAVAGRPEAAGRARWSGEEASVFGSCPGTFASVRLPGRQGLSPGDVPGVKDSGGDSQAGHCGDRAQAPAGHRNGQAGPEAASGLGCSWDSTWVPGQEAVAVQRRGTAAHLAIGDGAVLAAPGTGLAPTHGMRLPGGWAAAVRWPPSCHASVCLAHHLVLGRLQHVPSVPSL